MRGALKYGVPVAAGLGLAAYGAQQGATPGEAALMGGGAALGGAAGLLGARALAGKYSSVLPNLVSKGMEAGIGKSGRSVRERLEQQIVNSPEYMSRGQAKTLYAPETVGNIARTAVLGAPAALQAAARPGFAAGLVPASALAAGIGGAAAAQIPGALGVPGFAPQPIDLGTDLIDPESYGSSNSLGARYKAPTMQYV
jgi:hypothetical protein